MVFVLKNRWILILYAVMHTMVLGMYKPLDIRKIEFPENDAAARKVIEDDFANFGIKRSVPDYLFEKAHINEIYNLGRTPLTFAIQGRYWELAHKLVSSKYIDPNKMDDNGDIPLIMALKAGDLLLAQKLLNKGAHVNVVEDKETPLDIANRIPVEGEKVIKGKEDLIKLLREKDGKTYQELVGEKPRGHEGEEGEGKGRSPIYNKYLQGDINAKNDQGETALIRATKAGDFDAVKALLEAGALITITDFKNKNAWDYAKARGEDAIKKLLGDIVRKRQITKEDKEKPTPIIGKELSLEDQRKVIVKGFIRALQRVPESLPPYIYSQENINELYTVPGINFDVTPLMFALYIRFPLEKFLGHVKTRGLVLDITKRNSEGDTALDVAQGPEREILRRYELDAGVARAYELPEPVTPLVLPQEEQPPRVEPQQQQHGPSLLPRPTRPAPQPAARPEPEPNRPKIRCLLEPVELLEPIASPRQKPLPPVPSKRRKTPKGTQEKPTTRPVGPDIVRALEELTDDLMVLEATLRQ